MSPPPQPPANVRTAVVVPHRRTALDLPTSIWPPRGVGGRRAERLLEADCVLVGLDDSVELNRRVLILRGDLEDAMDQANTSASCGRRDHVWEGD